MRELTEEEKQNETEFILKVVKKIEKERGMEYGETEKGQIIKVHLEAVKSLYN